MKIPKAWHDIISIIGTISIIFIAMVFLVSLLKFFPVALLYLFAITSIFSSIYVVMDWIFGLDVGE